MISIPLSHPIEVDGATISSITIRTPTDEDRKAAKRGNFSKKKRGIAFVQLLTGLSYGAILKLNIEDERKIERFLDNCGL